MKKQTAIILTVSALLTLTVMAPKDFWKHDDVSRFPASDAGENAADVKAGDDAAKEAHAKAEAKKEAEVKAEDKEPNKEPKKDTAVAEEPKKEEPKKEEPKKDTAVAEEPRKLDKDEVVACLKKQSSDLADQIKKLLDDKKDILKKIAAVKKIDRDDRDDRDDSKSDKKKKKKDDASALNIMSQMTSLMASQQQQQQTMMMQMFSMMLNQQQPQQNRYSALNDYMSPYAYNPVNFSKTPYSNNMFDYSGVGVDVYGNGSIMNQNPYSSQMNYNNNREPSSQFSGQNNMDRQQMNRNVGFDFSNGGSNGSDLNRIQF